MILLCFKFSFFLTSKSFATSDHSSKDFQLLFGLGFNISFPVSSQLMLKSFSTTRIREVTICGAMTSL